MTVDLVAEPARPSLDAAERAADLALDCAAGHSIAIAVAIVDAAGRLICLKRMDAARPISADLAVLKARTAAAFERETDALQTMTAPGSLAFGAQFLDAAGAGILPGGCPIKTANGLHAAVGVSGADRDRDIACAKAACLMLTNILQE